MYSMHLSTEKKVILIGVIITVLFMVGAVFLLSKGEDRNVPEDQIISRRGIHWHSKLTITIRGEKQEITANIGIGSVHQPIHTHEDAGEGILHMEMSGLVTRGETKLGKFFQTWGKDFNSNCIFDKCNEGEGTVRMIVNGKENEQRSSPNKEFENYEMKDGDNIEIKFE